jgi:hypothetical protein
MHENLRVIFNQWRSYSDGKEWLIEEDNEAIKISYFNIQGVKLFSARLTRTENPSDSADVTCTLYYWGQTWNAMFACQEEQILRHQGGYQVKTLINLISDEVRIYEHQNITRSPMQRGATLAYKRDSSDARDQTWLRSDPIPPGWDLRRVQPDVKIENNILSRIKRIF